LLPLAALLLVKPATFFLHSVEGLLRSSQRTVPEVIIQKIKPSFDPAYERLVRMLRKLQMVKHLNQCAYCPAQVLASLRQHHDIIHVPGVMQMRTA
jgi:hypothetical protein